MSAAAAQRGPDQADFAISQQACRWMNEFNSRFEGLQSIALGPFWAAY